MPYIGEVMLFAGDKIPKDWMACAGQILPIAGNEGLFSVIGYAYGGDGTNFYLPDLRSVFPVQASSNVGQKVASASSTEPNVVLRTDNLPPHVHAAIFTGILTQVKVSTAVEVKLESGEAIPKEGGYLSKGAASGGGGADIYVPSTSKASSVKLSGGSAEAMMLPQGGVVLTPTGTGTAVSLPHVHMNWCICVSGDYPSET